MPNGLHNYILTTPNYWVLSDSLACLTMWFIIETHDSLQSSGLNFGSPLDLVQSLVVPITSKLLVKQRGNTERWNRP